MTATALTVGNLAPGSDLAAYIQTVNTVPMLSAEQETELAHRFIDDDDVEAARELVMSHLRVVVHLAWSLRGYGLSQGDLIQEGNVGLMKAVKRFDPSLGVRLVTFAVHWIKSEMYEFIIRNWRIVKIATTKAQRKLFFNLRKRKKGFNWLTSIERAAIANDLGVPAKEVAEMEGRLREQDVSAHTSEEHDADRPSPNAVPVLEDVRQNPEDLVVDERTQEQHSAALQQALQHLDDRDRDILYSRWLADDSATLQELGDRYDVSAERIRQLERKAMEKIRALLGPQFALT